MNLISTLSFALLSGGGFGPKEFFEAASLPNKIIICLLIFLGLL